VVSPEDFLVHDLLACLTSVDASMDPLDSGKTTVFQFLPAFAGTLLVPFLRT
jgi:hypothetical protein